MRAEKIKYIVPLLFLLFILLIPGDPNKKGIIRDIKSGYEGKLIDSLYHHGSIYIVQVKDTMYRLYLMDDSFTNHARVGDSIIKFKNKNECLIINQDKRIRVKYTFNPSGYTAND